LVLFSDVIEFLTFGCVFGGVSNNVGVDVVDGAFIVVGGVGLSGFVFGVFDCCVVVVVEIISY